LNGVSGSSSGGLLLTSKNEEKDSFFKVYNGTFTDFNQFSKETSSSLIMTSNNINIILEKYNSKLNNIYTTYYIYNISNINLLFIISIIIFYIIFHIYII